MLDNLLVVGRDSSWVPEFVKITEFIFFAGKWRFRIASLSLFLFLSLSFSPSLPLSLSFHCIFLVLSNTKGYLVALLTLSFFLSLSAILILGSSPYSFTFISRASLFSLSLSLRSLFRSLILSHLSPHSHSLSLTLSLSSLLCILK